MQHIDVFIHIRCHIEQLIVHTYMILAQIRLQLYQHIFYQRQLIQLVLLSDPCYVGGLGSGRASLDLAGIGDYAGVVVIVCLYMHVYNANHFHILGKLIPRPSSLCPTPWELKILLGNLQSSPFSRDLLSFQSSPPDLYLLRDKEEETLLFSNMLVVFINYTFQSWSCWRTIAPHKGIPQQNHY